jgi:hypothetical protein
VEPGGARRFARFFEVQQGSRAAAAAPELGHRGPLLRARRRLGEGERERERGIHPYPATASSAARWQAAAAGALQYVLSTPYVLGSVPGRGYYYRG